MTKNTVVTNPPAANPAARPPTVDEIRAVLNTITPAEWYRIKCRMSPGMPRRYMPVSNAKTWPLWSNARKYKALKKAMRRPVVSMFDGCLFVLLRDDFEPRRAEVSR